MTNKTILARLDALESAVKPPLVMEFPDYEAGWRRHRRYRKVFDLLFMNEGIEGFERRHRESLAKGKHLASRLLGKRENGERHTHYSNHLITVMMDIESTRVAESLKGRGERIWAEILAEREARGAFAKTTP